MAVILLLSTKASGADLFSDVAVESGLNFVHFNGMAGQLYYPEVMGSGVAFLDYDQDGDQDVYLVQGALIGTYESQDLVAKPQKPLIDRLFRNDLDESGRIRFTDVTKEVGLHSDGYGMGVAVGDINNDGYPDLFVANFGANQLWINHRGKFKEFEHTDKNQWSIGGSFFDYDKDGLQDLFVVNYVDYDIQNPRVCRDPQSKPDYCGPAGFKKSIDRLFRNVKGTHFADVTEIAGMDEAGAGMSSITADFNGDRHIDVFVANDGMANYLWINNGEGRFENQGLLSGVAVNGAGVTEASMGAAAADFDQDGDVDVLLTHLARETNTLYVNKGDAWFEDKTADMGLAKASLPLTGFGAGWFDLENDGDLDLLTVNGEVTFFASNKSNQASIFPLGQRNQVFIRSNGGFLEARSISSALEKKYVSRGAAFADVDNDGDMDVLISNNSGPVQLMINDAYDRKNSWIGFELIDKHGAVTPHGKVSVARGEDSKTLYRFSRVDGSYGSSNDSRILMGLGVTSSPVAVTVLWPDGGTTEHSKLSLNRYHRIQQPKDP